MADKILNTRIQLLNDTSANWVTNGAKVPKKGEVCLEYCTDGEVKIKIGDGVTSFADLKYFGTEIIGRLDKADAAVAGQFVTEVSEENGIISVVRAALQESDIPELAQSKITGLADALDGKADAATTLEGYGITDAYTQTEIGTKLGDFGAKSVKQYIDDEIDTVIAAGYDDTELAGKVDANTQAIAAINNADTGILKQAKTYADGKVGSVTATDASVTVGGTATAPTVEVQISADSDNALSLAIDGLKVVVPEAVNYTIKKLDTANAGFVASYRLTNGVDDTAIGADINIPKDYLVKSATIKEVATNDDPVAGFVVGQKYIDFVVNTSANDGTESHIYLNVQELVDAYTAGTGIAISGTNEVSVNLKEANGLSIITAEGADKGKIAVSLASTTAAGTVKGSTEKNKIAVASDGVMEVNSLDVQKLVQTAGDTLVFNCGTSTDI